VRMLSFRASRGTHGYRCGVLSLVQKHGGRLQRPRGAGESSKGSAHERIRPDPRTGGMTRRSSTARPWKEERTAGLVAQALTAGFRGLDPANQRKHYHEAVVGRACSPRSPGERHVRGSRAALRSPTGCSRVICPRSSWSQSRSPRVARGAILSVPAAGRHADRRVGREPHDPTLPRA
jgi:hypothetical protein